jgi:YbbR domain-containing protein
VKSAGKYGKDGKSMKVKIANNFGLKLLALLVAGILWLVIVNASDPITNKTFDNVPVKTINEDFIRSNYKEFYIAKGYSNSTSIMVTGRRSEIEKLKSDGSDFIVTANIQDMIQGENDINTVPITVDCNKVNLESMKATPQTLKITVEELTTKDFALAAEYVNNSKPAEGYEVGRVDFDRLRVSIKGPKKLIEIIDAVKVPINVNGITENEPYKDLAFEIYDKNGDKLSDTQMESLSFDTESKQPLVDATVILWEVKKGLKLDFPIKGSVPEGYQVVGTYYTPLGQDISFTGEAADLEAFINGEDTNRTLVISPENVTLDGKTESFETQIDLDEYLKEYKLRVANGSNKMLSIMVEIEPVVEKTLLIPVDKIELLNKFDNIKVSYGDLTTVSVTIKGLKKDLKTISEDSIKVSMDLAGCKEGDYTLPLVVGDNGLPKDVEVQAVTVNVALKDDSEK